MLHQSRASVKVRRQISQNSLAGDIDPSTIAPDAGWEEAVALMERLRIRHLPVVANGVTVGIVSARNLMARRTEHLDRLVAERTSQLDERDRQMRHNLEVAGRLMDRL